MATVQILKTMADLRAVKDDWNRLQSAKCSPLMQYEWFAAAAAALAGTCEPAIFVARDAGSVTGIAPMAIERGTFGPRLRFMSHFTSEPGSFLFNDKKTLAALCDAIVDCRMPTLVERFCADGDEIRCLQSAADGKGVQLARPRTSRTAFTPLEEWSSFERKMPKKSRTTIYQRLRAAERVGAVTFEVCLPDVNAIDVPMERLFKIESAGWKSRAGTAIVQVEAMRQFYMAYAREVAGNRDLYLFFLNIGGAAVAAQMSVIFSNAMWNLKIGHDESWSRYSPGILLTHKTLEYASKMGLERCEYLGAAETWQERWPIVLEDYTTFRFYPRTVRGSAELASDAVSVTARRLLGGSRKTKLVPMSRREVGS